MATYGEHKIKKTEKVKPSGSGTTKFTFDAYSIPAGEKFYRYKITGTYATAMCPLQKPAAAIGYGNWSTDTSGIQWTNGGKAIIVVNNSQSYSYNQTITITFQTKLNKVVAGNKIVTNDRSKSGTSTTQGAKMTDSNWASGTKITASAFNSAYGYTG